MDNDLQSSISGLSDSGAPPAPDASGAGPQPPSAATAPNLPQGVTAVPQAGAPAIQSQPSVPAPQPGTPHAGLRNILQNLFLGMDSFAKAAATGGREGGVQEVMAVRNQQRETALKEQAGQREQAQSDAMIKHTQALTNASIASTEVMKMNAPLEHQKLIVDNQKAMYDLLVGTLKLSPIFAVPIVQGQTTDTHMNAINGKANGDLVNNTVLPVHDDKVGGSGNSYGFSFDQLRKVNLPIEQAGRDEKGIVGQRL